MRRYCFATIAAALLTFESAWAAAPAKMTYQGVLRNTSGSIAADGTYQLTFKLHNAATAGSAVWTGAPQDVAVSKGLFTAILSGGSPDLSTVIFDQELFLSIAIGAGADLTPRIELTPTPYSMVARGVTANAVTGAMIANGTIGNAEISSSAAIDGSKINPSFSGLVSGGGYTGGPVTATKNCPAICLVSDMISANVSINFPTPTTNVVFRVASSGQVFADGSFNPGGADYADLMPVSGGATSVAPGDVLTIDPENPRSVIKATQPRSTLVAGIYSTKPGFVGAEAEPGKPNAGWAPAVVPTTEAPTAVSNQVPIALTGIVPCKVSAENGSIRPGDLLVTSGTPGHAMRDDNPRPGTLLGKALEPLARGTGTIKVLVALH